MLSYGLKSSLWFFLFQAVLLQPLKPAWSQTCENLFSQSEVHETKYVLSDTQIQSGRSTQLHSLDSVTLISEQLSQLLQKSNFNFLPRDILESCG